MTDMNVSLKVKASAEGVEQIKRAGQAVRDLGDAAAPASAGQDKAAESSRRLADQSENTADRLDAVKSALGALAGAAILQDLVRTAAQFEAMQKGLEALSGSAQAARAEMDYITDTADRLGVSVKDAAESYVSLSAATKGTALEGQNTRAIFEAVSGAMAKLGKSSAETQQALTAIGQMASKGTVSMEELRGQLGEALPGAMQAAARAMGVTVEELDKLVSTGKVSADEMLPKLAAELNKTFGTEPPDTLNAALARLQNKLDLAYKTFGETGSMGAFKVALEGVGAAMEAVAITASGAWESVELAGKGIGAVAAALAQAASGDIAGAWDALKTNIGEAVDQAATDIYRMSDALTSVGEEAQATAPMIAAPAQDAERLAESLKGAGDAGKASADEIAKAFAAIDLTTPAGVTAMIDAFALLGDGAAKAEKALSDYIATMRSANLSAFGQHLRALYQGGQVEADRFARINDQILAASFSKLGLTAETALGRITTAVNDGIAALQALGSAIAGAPDSPEAKMRALELATGELIKKLQNTTDIAAFSAELTRMEKAQTLSSEAAGRLRDALAEQRVKIEQAIPGIQSMEEAYRQLGITAQSELKKVADSNLAAFNTLEQGKAQLADLKAGFMVYAESAIKANNGVADSALLARADMLGMRDTVIDIELSALRASPAFKQMADRMKDVADAAKREGDAITKAADSSVAAAKAALESAKAKGDENEIRRASAALAKAEVAQALAVAEAKQIEADAALQQLSATRAMVLEDGVLTEAEIALLNSVAAVAEAKQREADAAREAAEAKREDLSASEGLAESTEKTSGAVSVAATQLNNISTELDGAIQSIRDTSTSVYDLVSLMDRLAMAIESGDWDKPYASLERQNEALKEQAKAARDTAEGWHMYGISLGVLGAAEFYGFIAKMHEIDAILAEQKIKANDLEIANGKLADSINHLSLEAENGEISLRQQLEELQRLQIQYRFLDEASLEKLKDEIDSVTDRLNNMSDAARDTLSDLRDEFDEMNGDLDAIEKRRADQRRADIETKMAEAQAAGNTQAVRDYQEALRLLDQVSKARIKDAAERERDGNRSSGTPGATPPRASSTPSTQPVKTVNVNINGRKVEVVAGSEDDLLRALETAGLRA